MDVVEKTFNNCKGSKLKEHKKKSTDDLPKWLSAALKRANGNNQDGVIIRKGEEHLYLESAFMTGVPFDSVYTEMILRQLSSLFLNEYCLFLRNYCAVKSIRRAATFVIMPLSLDRISGGIDSVAKCHKLGLLATASLSFLSKQKEKGICQVPLILGRHIDSSLLSNVFKKNTFENYERIVQAERQLMIKFIVSAHESNSKIGGCHNGMNVDEFSDRFIDTVDGVISKSTPFMISFHVCRCADITEVDFTKSESLSSAVLLHTFIGQFYTRMTSAGYNIIVEGYQGFFAYLISHKAAVCTVNGITLSHNKSMIRISSDGVVLPSTVYVINQNKEYIAVS